MNWTASVKGNSVSTAMVSALAELRNPFCDRANSHFGQRYATLSAVLDQVRPVLAKHGLAVLQPVTNSQSGMLSVTTVILHTSGETIESTVSVPLDARIQQIGAAITYLRRYSLSAMLGIVGEEDDDAESIAKGQRKSKPSAPIEGIQPVAGYQLLHPVTVDRVEKQGKKPFWRAALLNKANGEEISASTFSQTIAERLSASIGQPVNVAVEAKERDGKVWHNIKDAI